jgi:Flp pilus assembly protein TadG
VLLPVVGLAIDGGFAYFDYSRLVAATDAAALAGGRALSVNNTLVSQADYIQSVVNQYVNANLPPGVVNANSVQTSVSLTEANHIRTVKVGVTATINLSFLAMLGHPTATISSSGAASRRDVNMVLALDRSGSMGGVCTTMKNDAAQFVDMWSDGRDRLGLVTFMGNASINYPSTLYFKSQTPSMTTVLGQLNCGGNTGSAAAISLAHQQIMSAQEPGALNIIVFFTDGVPNGFTAGISAPGAKPGFPIIAGKTCNAGQPILGFTADGGGVFQINQNQSISQTSTPSVMVKGCSMSNFGQMTQLFTGFTEVDNYGNSATLSNYAKVARNSQGYITFSDANSDAVSENAADDAARQARADGISIYTIGLDGDGGVDSVLLQRIANDPVSPVFDASQPVGKYYYSPNAGQLGNIWNALDSELLRISQ